jgi:hypothetical protein
MVVVEWLVMVCENAIIGQGASEACWTSSMCAGIVDLEATRSARQSHQTLCPTATGLDAPGPNSHGTYRQEHRLLFMR